MEHLAQHGHASTSGGIPQSAPKDGTPARSSDVGTAIGMTSAQSDMSDCQREAAIVNAGREVEAHMRAYGESNDLTDRAAADAARLHMEALIRGRSREQVLQQEIRKGLI